jgi:hypothetical protein
MLVACSTCTAPDFEIVPRKLPLTVVSYTVFQRPRGQDQRGKPAYDNSPHHMGVGSMHTSL